jgi:hypothetical protein
VVMRGARIVVTFAPMRYRVEFLREAAEENSVCHARSLHAEDITVVAMQAIAWSGRARAIFGAEGFQIRDLDQNGCIVALEEFDEPLPSIH